jgi:hypothetical protein
VLGECLYAVGGPGQLSNVERYNVTSNTWRTVANMLEVRSYSRAMTIGSAGPAEEQDLFDALIIKTGHRGL